MTTNVSRINIAIKPPNDVAQYVSKLSLDISQKSKSYFVIDNQHYLSHITMYAPVVDLERIGEISEHLKNNIKHESRLVCRFKGIRIGLRYIGAEMESTNEILELKQNVASLLSSFAVKDLPEKYVDANDYNMKFNEESLQAIRQYGSVAMYNFHPHFTISRLRDEKEAVEIGNSIKWEVEEFTASSIGIYQMGDNGTCIRLLNKLTI